MENFTSELLLNGAGLAGVVFFPGSCALLQLGLLSLTVAFNLSPVIIQMSWVAIIIFGIAGLMRANQRLAAMAEQRA